MHSVGPAASDLFTRQPVYVLHAMNELHLRKSFALIMFFLTYTYSKKPKQKSIMHAKQSMPSGPDLAVGRPFRGALLAAGRQERGEMLSVCFPGGRGWLKAQWPVARTVSGERCLLPPGAGGCELEDGDRGGADVEER